MSCRVFTNPALVSSEKRAGLSSLGQRSMVVHERSVMRSPEGSHER